MAFSKYAEANPPGFAPVDSHSRRRAAEFGAAQRQALDESVQLRAEPRPRSYAKSCAGAGFFDFITDHFRASDNTVSILLKSWAIPPVNWPIAAIFAPDAIDPLVWR